MVLGIPYRRQSCSTTQFRCQDQEVPYVFSCILYTDDIVGVFTGQVEAPYTLVCYAASAEERVFWIELNRAGLSVFPRALVRVARGCGTDSSCRQTPVRSWLNARDKLQRAADLQGGAEFTVAAHPKKRTFSDDRLPPKSGLVKRLAFQYTPYARPNWSVPGRIIAISQTAE